MWRPLPATAVLISVNKKQYHRRVILSREAVIIRESAMIGRSKEIRESAMTIESKVIRKAAL